MHAMVDVINSDIYVEDYIKVYNHTKDLTRCQLGEMLISYLKSSQHITITK